MAFSRSARIWTLLIIDTIFLLIELIVGYAVGSLALVADAFHMLNDVLSLVVALYAIKLTTNSPTSRYSYGWHRAEILAALVNGVFLLALCLSIFLEAIGRFFAPPEISSPKLVVIVGSLGLASNILGLFLFHEHGHSHDDGTATPASDAPNVSANGYTTAISNDTETTPLLVPPKTPERHTSPRPYETGNAPHFGHPAQTRAHVVQAAEQAGYNSTLSFSPTSRDRSQSDSIQNRIKLNGSSTVPEDAVTIDVDGTTFGTSDDAASTITPHKHSRSHSHSSPAPNGNGHSHSHSHSHDHAGEHGHSHRHELHEHAEETLAKSGYGNAAGGHGGHSHGGSMNMHALLLHVLGDALGNVGVIASGLIIWLSNWPGKYYSDPVISLVITCIIFTSALPLVKSASFILLQGVPTSIALDELREDIRRVNGVTSLHELHVWQLSESKIIASVHVCVNRSVDYMVVAAEIREVLHEYNVHSCAIQPEFHDEDSTKAVEAASADGACLLPCPPGSECPPQSACCPTPPRPASR